MLQHDRSYDMRSTVPMCMKHLIAMKLSALLDHTRPHQLVPSRSCSADMLVRAADAKARRNVGKFVSRLTRLCRAYPERMGRDHIQVRGINGKVMCLCCEKML